MISAFAYIVAAIMILAGPVTRRQRPNSQNDQEGIWVNRSTEKEPAQAA